MHSGDTKHCANWFEFLILQFLAKLFRFNYFSDTSMCSRSQIPKLQQDTSLLSIILNESAKPKENIRNLHCVNQVYCELLREELSYCNEHHRTKSVFSTEFNRDPTSNKENSFRATRRRKIIRTNTPRGLCSARARIKTPRTIKLIAVSHVLLTCGEEDQVIRTSETDGSIGAIK